MQQSLDLEQLTQAFYDFAITIQRGIAKYGLVQGDTRNWTFLLSDTHMIEKVCEALWSVVSADNTDSAVVRIKALQSTAEMAEKFIAVNGAPRAKNNSKINNTTQWIDFFVANYTAQLALMKNIAALNALAPQK